MKPFAKQAFAWPDTAAAGQDAASLSAPLTVEVFDPERLATFERARWARLSTRAAPGNIFAQDWFMELALRHCHTSMSLRLVVVRQELGEWLGTLPVAFENSVASCPMPSWHSWRAASQFIGTPLVLPGAEPAFWQALLDHFDRRPGLALALCLDNLPLDDPATLALADLCARQNRPLVCVGQFGRPARMPGIGRDADRRDSAKLDRRLDALERKLARELGPVSLVLHRRSEEREAWIAAFLALEKAGWKGRTASALACCADNTQLFREVIHHGHRLGTVRLASLRAGDQIVAMSSWFIAAGHGYGFKMAHDEAWRRCAPGRLLMRRIARLHDSEAAQLFDTCSPPGSPPDALWPDTRAFGTFAVAIGGRTRRAMMDGLLAAGERWRKSRRKGESGIVR